jgi:hypothetical protein
MCMRVPKNVLLFSSAGKKSPLSLSLCDVSLFSLSSAVIKSARLCFEAGKFSSLSLVRYLDRVLELRSSYLTLSGLF